VLSGHDIGRRTMTVPGGLGIADLAQAMPEAEIVDLAKQLMAIPSHTPEETELAQYVAEYLTANRRVCHHVRSECRRRRTSMSSEDPLGSSKLGIRRCDGALVGHGERMRQ
jgi:hypothetical protein